jgi:hypothetical protein
MRSAPLFGLSILLLAAGCATAPWGGSNRGDDDGWSDDDDDAVSVDDTDGDTISDLDDGTEDPDGDGDINLRDLDSDGDTLLDSLEAGDADLLTPPVDSDGDSVPDFLDLDSDGNGIPDAVEGGGDYDDDGIHDAADLDNDGDGISDEIEIGGNPAAPVDSDGDGTPDYLDYDSDGDGIPDYREGADDPDGDGIPSYLDDDSDNDGIPDADEVGPDPENPLDSDGDGFYDFEDADSDNDGILDPDEPTYGTDPFNRDTDNDGFSDLAEVAVGSDPLDPSDVPDGFYAELSGRTETVLDIPFTPEISQADILFVLDATCSMTNVLNNIAGDFASVVSQITIPNLAFGVAEFEDYGYSSFGASVWGDRPFRLQQQITTATGPVQSALSSLTIKEGYDAPESSMEALFQAASGLGFDQNCNNSFQSTTDVRPFIPLTGPPISDAFGGQVGGTYSSGVTGTGTIGGAGFREGSVPIIVYTTDNWMRDADNSSSWYDAGSGTSGFLNQGPPSCSDPAGQSDVVAAVAEIGGKLIAVGTNPIPIPQMTALANATGSLADLDGDGIPDPLVFQSGAGSTVTNVIAGIEAIAGGGLFDLTLTVDDAGTGLLTGITPNDFPQISVGTEVTFQVSLYPNGLTTSDQVFVFPMQVLGDGITVLAEWELIVIVLAGA